MTDLDKMAPQPSPTIDLEQFRGAVLAMGREAIEKERASRSNPLLRVSDWYQDKCREVGRLLALIDGSKNNNLPHVGDINVVVSQPNKREET